jgi:hypothetical protein
MTQIEIDNSVCLPELIANYKALQTSFEAFSKLMDERNTSIRELLGERDRRYNERVESNHMAVQAALAAVKESNIKAELAQREYNVLHNSLATQMKDQYKEMLSASQYSKDQQIISERLSQTMVRGEYEREHKALSARVDELRDVQIKRYGKEEGAETSQSTKRWIIGLSIVVLLGITGQMILLLTHILK